MKKVVERLLIFSIGIPAVYGLVFLLPFCRHLPFNIIVIIFSAIGAVEFSAMLEKKQIYISKIESFILGALAATAATLTVSLNFSEWVVPLILMAGAGWALLSRVFSSSKDMETIINRIAGCLSVMVYPGFFMYWIIKMNVWENPGAIFLFLVITFGNDSSSWFTGNLFGKNNRGIIHASPNKSIAGFIGGLLGSVIISTGAVFLFPSVFSISGLSAGSDLFTKAAILGLCTGIFASLGDLAESAIKRSCGFKDSGNLMLGRGGILDSIDSIAIAAPVFFLLYSLFFYTF
jgi:phosphatidate cytidylyltransferase